MHGTSLPHLAVALWLADECAQLGCLTSYIRKQRRETTETKYSVQLSNWFASHRDCNVCDYAGLAVSDALHYIRISKPLPFSNQSVTALIG